MLKSGLPTDALALLQDRDDPVAAERTPQGCAVLACPVCTRFGDRAGLVVWRVAGGAAWDAGDRTLAASVAGLIRMMLEHEGIQRELALQARTDPLTGLLNRRAFLEDAGRRIDRLEREGLVAREPCPDDRRKVEYRLTEKGFALLPTMIALRQWGERWETGEPAFPVLVDERDRLPIQQVAVLAHDGRVLGKHDLLWALPTEIGRTEDLQAAE